MFYPRALSYFPFPSRTPPIFDCSRTHLPALPALPAFHPRTSHSHLKWQSSFDNNWPAIMRSPRLRLSSDDGTFSRPHPVPASVATVPLAFLTHTRTNPLATTGPTAVRSPQPGFYPVRQHHRAVLTLPRAFLSSSSSSPSPSPSLAIPLRAEGSPGPTGPVTRHWSDNATQPVPCHCHSCTQTARGARPLPQTSDTTRASTR